MINSVVERRRSGTSIGAATHRLATASRWVGLAVVLTGQCMASVDVSIVNVAMPLIRSELGVSGASLVLVVSGYTLAYAMLLITGARLGDAYGHRRLFMLGLAGFTLASLVCGLAPNDLVLIVARVVQGGAGALMVPQVLSMIQLRFEGDERVRALGLYATVLSVGAVAGQVVGGALVTADLFGSGWRPVFLVNVPIGMAMFVAASRYLEASRGAAPRRSDFGGVALLSAAVLLIVLPLILGQEQRWPSWTFLSLGAGAALLSVTGWYFRRRARQGCDPLVDLSIFSSGGVSRGLVSLFAMMVAYGGFLFSLTLHLQAGLGASPLRSGLTFAPFAVGFALTSLGHEKWPAAIRRWTPPGGLVVMAIGYATLGRLDRSGAWLTGASALALALAGAGFGAGFSPMIARTVARVATRLAPDASGLVGTTVQLGFLVGVATLGTFFLSAAPGDAASAGHAFSQVAVALAVLALVAAGLCERANE